MAAGRTSGAIILGAAILLLAVFVAQYGPQLSSYATSANTTPVFTDQNKFHFGGYFAAGDANTHTGTVFDSAQYVTAWSYDDYSEKILAQAVFCKEGGINGWIIQNDGAASSSDPSYHMAFRWDIKVNGQAYATYYYPATFTGQATCGAQGNPQIPTPLMFTQLKGPVTGIVSISLSVFMVDQLSLFGTHGWYGPAVYQEANLVSGAGHCSFVGPAGVTRPALTRENLTVSCDLGVASSTKIGNTTTSQGWQLWGSWSSSPLLKLGNGPGFGVQGTFPAPSAAGIYSLRLLNTIFIRDAYDFTVNVAGPNATANAPPMPDITVDPQPAWATGTTVTMSWTSQPNSNTHSPIAKVWVHVFYASDGTDLIPLTSFPGANGSTTFIVGKNLDVRIFVASQDTSGLYSVQREPTYQTYGCDINNSCRPPPPPGPLPLWVFILIAGIIAIAAAALLPTNLSKSIKIKPIWRMILVVLGVVMVGVAYLIFAG